MRRDINKVIAYLVREVIPPTEKEILKNLADLYRDTFYTAPEVQPAMFWLRLTGAVNPAIGDEFGMGDTKGIPWKDKLARIISNQEQVPESFNELPSVEFLAKEV